MGMQAWTEICPRCGGNNQMERWHGEWLRQGCGVCGMQRDSHAESGYDRRRGGVGSLALVNVTGAYCVETGLGRRELARCAMKAAKKMGRRIARKGSLTSLAGLAADVTQIARITTKVAPGLWSVTVHERGAKTKHEVFRSRRGRMYVQHLRAMTTGVPL